MTRKEAFEKLPLPRWYGMHDAEHFRGWLLDSLAAIDLIKFDTDHSEEEPRETK